MTRYASGRRAEWRARDWLRRRGYTVIRSAGSKGLVDLVGWRGHRYDESPTSLRDVVFVQVKYTRQAKGKRFASWVDENWRTLSAMKADGRTPHGVGIGAIIYHYGDTVPEVFWL